jgi:ATP-dependent Lon protease
VSLLGKARRGTAPELPLVLVRDSVVFPKAVTPLFISGKLSVAAVDAALLADKRIVVAIQRGGDDDKAESIDVFPVAVSSRIVQQLRLPDGSLRLLVEGEARVRIKRVSVRANRMVAIGRPLEEVGPVPGSELETTLRLVKRNFGKYAEIAKKIPPETLSLVEQEKGAHGLVDLVAHALPLKFEIKRDLLEMEDAGTRLEAIESAIENELELLNLQRKIGAKVKTRIDRNQKEYLLNEQLKEINKELGRDGDENEIKELERALLSKSPPGEVADKAKRELSRLGKLQSFSPEAGVLRVYCEWLADLPWSAKSTDNKDLERARRMLDEDHYGMEKPKERILEFIAVRQLSDRARGPILCLVGPPGTGKTSLGRSVARALDRSFVRASLGGLRDEAEIRGHRKTYVGALPGKIIQSMKKAGTINPVFLLDEIDKMSSDFRGDPASALLEVLDPEQNSSFTDHYLELPYDLSSVMFITTANSIQGIPYPLLDRMEIIDVPGYSEYEKLEIAKRFIVPKQIEENGLGTAEIAFRDAAILDIVRHYTMESGVRNLEREIAHVMRKLAQEAIRKGFAADATGFANWKTVLTEKRVAQMLGRRRREEDSVFKEPRIGVAYGLAWTASGGTILPVESLVFGGEEGLILTGNLGDVMKESARAALSFIQSRAQDFRLGESDFRKRVVHVHVPEGAIPKDGPSAGVTLIASMLSAFTGKSLVPDRAMTGEITLTGRVLAIGGVKEKVLAAHRNKIGTVILPEGNRSDIEDIPSEVRDAMSFVFASSVTQVLEALFPSGAFKEGAPNRRNAPTIVSRRLS